MNSSQRLGIKVFYYYLSRRITIGIILLVVSFIVLSSKDAIASKFVLLFSVSTTTLLVNYLTTGLFMISTLFILGAAFVSWLSYISCSFILGENALSITRGLLNKKEISIPYRQIQNIDIEQSLSYRMMGVSKLVILTAGNDNDNSDKVTKSEGVFDVIESKLAMMIKEYILQRANLQIVKDSVI